MVYKRIQKVSSMMIDFQSAKLLDYVTDEKEKLLVWDTVLNYFEKAREKDADVQFEMPNVSKASENAIKGMIESIDDGIYKFWKMVEKNTKARNGGQKDDQRSTTGQPQEDGGSTNIKENNINKNNENSLYYTATQDKNITVIGFHRTNILQSNRADEYKRVLSAMKDFGYELTSSVTESIANKMEEDFIDENDVMDAIRICRNKNNGDIRYFFAILKHKVEGWGN